MITSNLTEKEKKDIVRRMKKNQKRETIEQKYPHLSRRVIGAIQQHITKGQL
jgi:hypothetical protein